MNKYQVVDTSTQKSTIEIANTERGARLRGGLHLGVPFRWTIAIEVKPEEPTVYLVPVDPADETNCEACQ